MILCVFVFLQFLGFRFHETLLLDIGHFFLRRLGGALSP